MKQQRLPSEFIRKTVTNRKQRTKHHRDIGITISSQCSPLSYHRRHSREKINRINRAHGGWIEQSNEEDPAAQASSSSSRPLWENYPVQDLSESDPEDSASSLPFSRPTNKTAPHEPHRSNGNHKCSPKLLLDSRPSPPPPNGNPQHKAQCLQPDSKNDDGDAVLSPQLLQREFIPLLAHNNQHQNHITSPQLDPKRESFLPVSPTQQHPSHSSCALFFFEGDSPEHNDHTSQKSTEKDTLCPESPPSQCQDLELKSPPARHQESFLAESMQNTSSHSCALFFEHGCRDSLPSPERLDLDTGNLDHILCPSSQFAAQHLIHPESILPQQTQDQAFSCALFFEGGREVQGTQDDLEFQLDHPTDNCKPESPAPNKIVLADETQIMSSGRSGSGTRSLAPPTPISVRRQLNLSATLSHSVGPQTKRKSVSPSNLVEPTSQITQEQEEKKKKKRHTMDVLEARVKPAWTCREADKVAKHHPPVLRQTGIAQFLVPLPDSPSSHLSPAGPAVQKPTSQADPDRLPYLQHFNRLLLASRTSQISCRPTTSSSVQTRPVVDPEDNAMVSDHDDEGSMIPDSQPLCTRPSISLHQAEEQGTEDACQTLTSDVEDRLRDRVRLAQARESVCQLALLPGLAGGEMALQDCLRVQKYLNPASDEQSRDRWVSQDPAPGPQEKIPEEERKQEGSQDLERLLMGDGVGEEEDEGVVGIGDAEPGPTALNGGAREEAEKDEAATLRWSWSSDDKTGVEERVRRMVMELAETCTGGMIHDDDPCLSGGGGQAGRPGETDLDGLLAAHRHALPPRHRAL
ncbi:hypothetical protein VP01_3366g1, partial [Puccinia sorghi]